MNWVILNTETDSIVSGFVRFDDASNSAKELNTQYQTNAYRVKAFDLYYRKI